MKSFKLWSGLFDTCVVFFSLLLLIWGESGMRRGGGGCGGCKVCFARAYFDMGVRKRLADCTYILLHANFSSQLSCHTIKGKEQSSHFVSSHLRVDKAVTFFVQTLYFSLSSTSLSLQGPHAAINFNICCSNRCSLELCKPGTKTEQYPHSSLST